MIGVFGNPDPATYGSGTCTELVPNVLATASIGVTYGWVAAAPTFG